MQPPVSSHQDQSAAPQKTRVPSRRSQFLKSGSDESRQPSPPAPPRTASSSALTSRAFGASQKKPEERQCSRLYRLTKIKAPAPQKARVPSRRSQFLKTDSDESRSPSPPAPPRTSSSSAPASRAFGASQKKAGRKAMQPPVSSHQDQSARAAKNTRPVPTQPIPENRQRRKPLARLTARSPTNRFLQRSHIARPISTQPIPKKRQPRRFPQRSENLPMICRPARRPCAVFSHRSRPSPAAGCPPLDAGAYKKAPRRRIRRRDAVNDIFTWRTPQSGSRE